MLIKFNSRYGNDLICNDIVNRVLVSISDLCSGEKHSVCIHFHVICVVVLFKCYREGVISDIGDVGAVRGINRISVTVLCRSDIQCICHKPRINRHIFVKRRCFINCDAADILSVPADKTVTGL